MTIEQSVGILSLDLMGGKEDTHPYPAKRQLLLWSHFSFRGERRFSSTSNGYICDVEGRRGLYKKDMSNFLPIIKA